MSTPPVCVFFFFLWCNITKFIFRKWWWSVIDHSKIKLISFLRREDKNRILVFFFILLMWQKRIKCAKYRQGYTMKQLSYGAPWVFFLCFILLFFYFVSFWWDVYFCSFVFSFPGPSFVSLTLDCWSLSTVDDVLFYSEIKVKHKKGNCFVKAKPPWIFKVILTYLEYLSFFIWLLWPSKCFWYQERISRIERSIHLHRKHLAFFLILMQCTCTSLRAFCREHKESCSFVNTSELKGSEHLKI